MQRSSYEKRIKRAPPKGSRILKGSGLRPVLFRGINQYDNFLKNGGKNNVTDDDKNGFG